MLKETWKRFRQNKLAMVGMCIFTFFFLIAVLSLVHLPGETKSIIMTHDPTEINAEDKLQGASKEHWLGTDALGRDIYSRLVQGTKVSMSIGFEAMGISLFIGTIYGLIAGFFGGKIDNLLMRIVDIGLVIPTFFLILTIMAIMDKPSIHVIVLVMGLTGWLGFSRMIRAEVLGVMPQLYIEAARSIGAGTFRLMFRHVLPNVIGPLFTAAALGTGGAILTETGLSFFGLGVQAPNASWGSVLKEGYSVMVLAPHIVISVGILILIVVLAFNFIGEGVRDALDPKLKEAG
ncbi:MAG: ABC transporter permease [Nanoarchaeota archaeon]|nr:ABC transporter permease [Nanoarchaeota archaeon]